MALPHLWVDGVCVDDDSLEVLEVCVVLQRSHVQPSLFTQLRGGSNQCTSSSSTRVIEHDALQTAATAVDPPHSSVGTFVSQQLHHTAQQVLSLAPCHQVWSQPIQAIAELLLKSS
jgi:hypothetical protein